MRARIFLFDNCCKDGRQSLSIRPLAAVMTGVVATDAGMKERLSHTTLVIRESTSLGDDNRYHDHGALSLVGSDAAESAGDVDRAMASMVV